MSTREKEGSGPRIDKIGGLYSLGRKLGSGSFGEIFYVVNAETGEELAVKLESTSCKHPQLMYEAKLLKHLQGMPGIARVHYFGVQDDYNAMVIDLLGPSLEDLFNTCSRRFSLKSVLSIADQMLHRVEYLHSKSFIHRDIKPDNFLVGHEELSSTVFMIDFGLAKKYRDPKARKHIPYCENKSLTGTARYASINAHLGIEQSRRDDLEAVGYVLMYFNRGTLPWQGLKASTKEEKYRKIMESKMSTPVETLCKGHPSVFYFYLNYSRSLRFEDRPDYAYLRRLFKDLFIQQGYVNDGAFDWTRPSSRSRTTKGDATNSGAPGAFRGSVDESSPVANVGTEREVGRQMTHMTSQVSPYSSKRRNSGEDSERQRRYSTERRSERSMEANRSSDRERARESNRSARGSLEERERDKDGDGPWFLEDSPGARGERHSNRERDRGTESRGSSHRDRDRERDRERNRDSDREGKDKERDRDRDRDRDRERDRDKDRDRDRDRVRDRDRDENRERSAGLRDKDREREKEKDKEKEKEKEKDQKNKKGLLASLFLCGAKSGFK